MEEIELDNQSVPRAPSLPEEIWLQILGHLDEEDKLTLMTVSKQWYRFISTPSLWQNFVYFGTSAPNWGSTPTEATARRIAALGSGHIQNISVLGRTTWLPQLLQSIIIDNTSTVREFTVNIRDDSLARILCTQLPLMTNMASFAITECRDSDNDIDVPSILSRQRGALILPPSVKSIRMNLSSDFMYEIPIGIENTPESWSIDAGVVQKLAIRHPSMSRIFSLTVLAPFQQSLRILTLERCQIWSNLPHLSQLQLDQFFQLEELTFKQCNINLYGFLPPKLRILKLQNVKIRNATPAVGAHVAGGNWRTSLCKELEDVVNLDTPGMPLGVAWSIVFNSTPASHRVAFDILSIERLHGIDEMEIIWSATKQSNLDRPEFHKRLLGLSSIPGRLCELLLQQCGLNLSALGLRNIARSRQIVRSVRKYCPRLKFIELVNLDIEWFDVENLVHEYKGHLCYLTLGLDCYRYKKDPIRAKTNRLSIVRLCRDYAVSLQIYQSKIDLLLPYPIVEMSPGIWVYLDWEGERKRRASVN